MRRLALRQRHRRRPHPTFSVWVARAAHKQCRELLLGVVRRDPYRVSDAAERLRELGIVVSLDGRLRPPRYPDDPGPPSGREAAA